MTLNLNFTENENINMTTSGKNMSLYDLNKKINSC